MAYATACNGRHTQRTLRSLKVQSSTCHLVPHLSVTPRWVAEGGRSMRTGGWGLGAGGWRLGVSLSLAFLTEVLSQRAKSMSDHTVVEDPRFGQWRIQIQIQIQIQSAQPRRAAHAQQLPHGPHACWDPARAPRLLGSRTGLTLAGIPHGPRAGIPRTTRPVRPMRKDRLRCGAPSAAATPPRCNTSPIWKPGRPPPRRRPY